MNRTLQKLANMVGALEKTGQKPAPAPAPAPVPAPAPAPTGTNPVVPPWYQNYSLLGGGALAGSVGLAGLLSMYERSKKQKANRDEELDNEGY